MPFASAISPTRKLAPAILARGAHDACGMRAAGVESQTGQIGAPATDAARWAQSTVTAQTQDLRTDMDVLNASDATAALSAISAEELGRRVQASALPQQFPSTPS